MALSVRGERIAVIGAGARGWRLFWGMAAIGVCAMALLVPVALATTAPNMTNNVRVVLTGSAIEIPRDQFVLKNGVTRYPRGAIINFIFYNESKKSLSIELAVAQASSVVRSEYLKLKNSFRDATPIRPGAVGRFKVAFDFRGNYVMKAVANGAVVARTPINIF
jgi:hypothetical protein